MFFVFAIGARSAGAIDRTERTRIETRFVHACMVPIVPYAGELVVDGEPIRIPVVWRSAVAAWGRWIPPIVGVAIVLSWWPATWMMLRLAYLPIAGAALAWLLDRALRSPRSEEAALRAIFAEFASEPVDVRWPSHFRDRAILRAEQALFERSASLGASGYREAHVDDRDWRQVARRLAPSDEGAWRAALTLARAEGDRAFERELRRTRPAAARGARAGASAD